MSEYKRFQRQSRRMALCGALAALSAVMLSVGSLVPMFTYACPMLAMLCLIPIVCDYGAKTALLVYAAVSVLGLMLCADKELAFFYLVLGWYPALRPRLERLPRAVRVLMKCLLFTLAMIVMYSALIFLFRMEAVAEEFAEYSIGIFAGMLVFGNASFLLEDSLMGKVGFLYGRRKKRN